MDSGAQFIGRDFFPDGNPYLAVQFSLLSTGVKIRCLAAILEPIRPSLLAGIDTVPLTC
jgi:hypothetical protein